MASALMDGGDHGSALALRYLSEVDHALILCADDLSVRWLNARARILLETSGMFALLEGRWICLTRAQQTVLEALAGSEGGCLVLPSQDHQKTLILRLRPITRPAAPRFIAITIFAHPQTKDFSLPDLSELYDFTPAEERVLRCLVEGDTAADVAKRLKITIETARTHIRRIYAKMGVSSREKMISLANRYRVP